MRVLCVPSTLFSKKRTKATKGSQDSPRRACPELIEGRGGRRVRKFEFRNSNFEIFLCVLCVSVVNTDFDLLTLKLRAPFDLTQGMLRVLRGANCTF